jgi:F-type H+-transporting ATPase subunit gamma
LASTQDLKRRVRSITNTRKLTRAMELVASARLRRAQQRIEAMRPYADRMLELMAGVSQAAGAVRLPLLERRANVERRSCRSPATAGSQARSTRRCSAAPSC